jgi:uncharacterized protein (TIGR02246 family)
MEVTVKADEQAIRNLIAQWHSATAAGDVDTILGLMAEDVVFLVAGKPPMKGRSTFEKGLRGLLKSHRVESRGDVQEVQVSGDLAYCWTLLTVRMTSLSGGNTNERSGSALSILRREANGSWALVRDANLLAPA